jgi:hypothetical protein
MLDENRVQTIGTNVEEHEASRVYVEGIIAGIIGATVLAVWFFILDTLHGRPLYTPSVLGSALFSSNHAPSEIHDLAVSIEMTIMYTWVHMLGFAVVGVIASRLLVYAEENPNFGFAILLLFVFLEFGFVGVAYLFAEPLLGLIAWHTALMGNLLAAVGMAGYLWYHHRNLTISP